MNNLEEKYILSAGRSRRDFDTFIKAVVELDYPSLILTNDLKDNIKHDTFISDKHKSSNVKIIYHDNNPVSWNETLAKSKVLVLCISPDTITASGIGTYFVAMALKKPIIITDSPATKDILKNGINAIIVPPKDPIAVREAIRKVLENDDYRKKIAENGYKYAISLGGTENLLKRIARFTINYLEKYN